MEKSVLFFYFSLVVRPLPSPPILSDRAPKKKLCFAASPRQSLFTLFVSNIFRQRAYENNFAYLTLFILTSWAANIMALLLDG